jgi:hypothetical protein
MYGTVKINKTDVIRWSATRTRHRDKTGMFYYNCDVQLVSQNYDPYRGIVCNVWHDPGEGALVLAAKILATAIEKGLR